MPREPKAHDPLTHRARESRQDSSFPERLLWGLLRNRKLAGMKFRRQFPIGCYIVDYFCFEESLIVELDGASHTGRFKSDSERQRFLESNGFRVLRLTNDDVMSNREAVALAILKFAGKPLP